MDVKAGAGSIANTVYFRAVKVNMVERAILGYRNIYEGIKWRDRWTLYDRWLTGLWQVLLINSHHKHPGHKGHIWFMTNYGNIAGRPPGSAEYKRPDPEEVRQLWEILRP